MAKTKSRKATTAGASSKKIRIIAGIVLLAIILVLSVVFGVTYSRSNGYASTSRTFYVDVNGERYYKGGNVQLKPHSITTFKCGYTAGNQNADKLYNVRISSTVTDKTAFTYTLNGAKRMFMDGEDYTQYFDITKNADGFEIAFINDTPATILKRRHAGMTVNVPETDSEISYFTLNVSNADGSQTIDFALTFGSVMIELDPGIIF